MARVKPENLGIWRVFIPELSLKVSLQHIDEAGSIPFVESVVILQTANIRQ